MGLVQSHILETSLSTIAFQMVFQGLLSAVISGITFNQMVRHFGPVRTTMFTAVVPGLGALGASIFLDEVLSLSVFLGLTLVTLGVLFGIGLRSSKNKLR
jgi:drug/metabolite transporter (DMT)-like permease